MISVPTVYVLDDQMPVVVALTRLLGAAGYQVIGFDSPAGFLDAVASDAPGCLVLDLSMPQMSGMAVQRALRARHSAMPIIFLSGHADLATGIAAMRNGAYHFLSKPVDAEQLLATVAGAFLRNASALARRARLAQSLALLGTLTPREREVFTLIAAGKLNKQVAAQLGTVEKTVKVHRARVMQKIQVQTFADLVRFQDDIERLQREQAETLSDGHR